MGGWGGCPSLTPHTHTRYKWYTSSLPMLAVFYFIFSKRSSFQSGNRQVVVHSNTTPRLPEQSLVRTACVCVCACDTAVSALKWSQWGARCRRRHGERRDTGCLVNLRRIWNCQVIAMPCHRFERMQKQLLTGDWQTDRLTGKWRQIHCSKICADCSGGVLFSVQCLM